MFSPRHSVQFPEIAKFRLDLQRARIPRLIQAVFTSHRIGSHDEKAHRFLNIFQLKSQSFVTFSSAPAAPATPARSDRRPLSPFSPYSFSNPRLPTPFTSSFCLSSREKRQKERERNRRIGFSPAITSLPSVL